MLLTGNTNRKFLTWPRKRKCALKTLSSRTRKTGTLRGVWSLHFKGRDPEYPHCSWKKANRDAEQAPGLLFWSTDSCFTAWESGWQNCSRLYRYAYVTNDPSIFPWKLFALTMRHLVIIVFRIGLITVFCAILMGVGRATRNFSVCVGVRWQITFFKIEFYKICGSLC